MSKFNAVVSPEKTINYMGEKAFVQKPELALVSLLLTSFVSDSYYEKEKDALLRLRKLISECDPYFVAKAAIYARTVFGMRSITHVVAAELAKAVSGKPWASNFYNKVIHRPDDMLEIAAYYNTNCALPSSNKRKKKGITAAMKKGFETAISKLDAYKLAKYRGEGKDFKLIDIVNLVHPKAYNNAEAIKALVAGKLKSSDTWESELTQAGQKASNEEELAEFKKDVWVKLIKERKIGYFALLRNLRNIIEQAPEIIEEALLLLTDKKLISKSLVLPFRYLSAYSEIEKLNVKKVFEKDGMGIQQILSAIEKAILLSIDNLPILEGKTVILSDNSGSMRGDGGGNSLVSKMSSINTSNIANLFALLYWLKSDNTFVGLFGDRLLQPEIKRELGLFENFKIVDRTGASCGGGTETGIFTMLQKMINEKIIANTIVIFSDCQIGSGCKWYGGGYHAASFAGLFSEYKKINPNVRVYSIDLKSYGNTVFDGSVIKMAGWSEKIFEIMKFAEQDKNALINEIKKIEL